VKLGNNHDSEKFCLVIQGLANTTLGCPAESVDRTPRIAAALHTKPLEFDMRCGIHGGNPTRVTGLDQGLKAGGEPDKMSLPPPTASFGENDLSRNSRALDNEIAIAAILLSLRIIKSIL
jgi:hypothetical protein